MNETSHVLVRDLHWTLAESLNELVKIRELKDATAHQGPPCGIRVESL
jgi:hypothetical protein